MQSLQMRCPVAATIGLSMAMVASAATAWPCVFSWWNSEMRSSSGQPARLTPNGERFHAASPEAPGLSRIPFEQESLPWLWHQMQ